MTVLIVGGGKLVYFLARSFIAKGYSVTVINRDRQECEYLARHLKASVVFGEGSDRDILEEAGAGRADAVLAVTPNDHDNLVVCQMAGRHFGVSRTLALVNDPDHEAVFRKLGITAALSPTRILSSLIEQQAGFEEVLNLIPVGDGRVNVTEVVLNGASPAIGSSLEEVHLPEGSLIACILRGEQTIVPRGRTVLQGGDRLIVISLPESYGAVLKALTAEPGL